MTEKNDVIDKAVEKVVGGDKGEDLEGKVKQLEGQVEQLKAQNKNLTQILMHHIRFVNVISNSIGNLPAASMGRD